MQAELEEEDCDEGADEPEDGLDSDEESLMLDGRPEKDVSTFAEEFAEKLI